MPEANPPSAPSVTLELKTGPRVIVFDMGKLIDLEERLGKGCAEYLQEELMPIAAAAEASTSVTAAAKILRIKTLAGFVGACLGCEPRLVDTVINPGSLMKVFVELLGGLSAALGQLIGDQAHTPDPRSADSAPGHASSSASDGTNSPASPPGS